MLIGKDISLDLDCRYYSSCMGARYDTPMRATRLKSQLKRI